MECIPEEVYLQSLEGGIPASEVRRYVAVASEGMICSVPARRAAGSK